MPKPRSTILVEILDPEGEYGIVQQLGVSLGVIAILVGLALQGVDDLAALLVEREHAPLLGFGLAAAGRIVLYRPHVAFEQYGPGEAADGAGTRSRSGA